jgi:hypothetical protein
MPFQAQARTNAAVIAAIVLTGFAVSLAVNLPGHLSSDSVNQLLEGRRGAYADWHPPLMSWLLGVFDAIVPGTGLFVIFDSVLIFGALLLLLFLGQKFRPLWVAALVAAILAATPQFVIYPGTVWKDVLFAGLAAFGFVCLALAAAHWANARLRFGLIALSLLALAAAALARQNGAVVIPAAAVALGWIAARETPASGKAFRRGLIHGIAALAAMALLALSGRAALQTHVTGHGTDAQIAILETYDIIGALKLEPSLKLDDLADPTLARELRTDGVVYYSPERNDTLMDSAPLFAAMNNSDPHAVAAQWRDLVFHHTGLYLKVRWDVFRWVFATPDLALCLPTDAGIDGDSDALQALGMTRRWDNRDQALYDYGHAFVGTPVLSHVTMAVLAIGAMMVLLWRRRGADIAIAAMLAAALVFTLTFFVLSIACDYRYLYFLDIAAMTALFYLALDIPFIAA